MDVFALLRTGKSRRASDLHMVAGSPAAFRIDGSLQPANGIAPLTAEDINEAFLQLTTPEEREHFHRQLELDFGYTMPDVGRLRCNAAQQRGSISLAVRLLPPKIPTIDELELPQICKELAL
ncbi:MAG: type IV pili twitching motility protein PilT, partial [Dehalococcoidia bacterium]|nr:type IV pili twitching motility protein PilT [Dehalococcoidia bacterium]